MQYSCLQSDRQIRLLDLEPADGHHDNLYCQIHNFSLDEEVEYEALSYTWGPSEPESTLYCDGYPLQIRSNLDSALRHLRIKNAFRRLWIDAVCINQSNLNECNTQSPLMGDIYSKAIRVIAWIGQEDPTDAMAMKTHDVFPVSKSAEGKYVASAFMTSLGRYLQHVFAVSKIIQRPWFSRAWIIQEVALSKSLVLQCGNRTLEWKEFYQSVSIVSCIRPGGVDIGIGNPCLERIHFIDRERSSVETLRVDGHPETHSDTTRAFQTLVFDGRSYGASDARDHIYALLGLAREHQEIDFHVDKSESKGSIYRRFVRQMVKGIGGLVILGQCDSSLHDDLESWVPNFNSISEVKSLSKFENPLYSASANTNLCVHDCADASILGLSGTLIDTIEDLTIGPTNKEERVHNRAQIMSLKAADNIHLSEILPSLAVKVLSRRFPQQKELFEKIHRHFTNPEGNKDYEKTLVQSSGVEFGGEAGHLSKRVADALAAVPEDLDDIEKWKKLYADLNISYLRIVDDTRHLRQNWMWGPVHPVHGVYMKPRLEKAWLDLARNCKSFPAGDTLDEAFWRTLIGNRRNRSSDNPDTPTNDWRDAFRVWQQMLWRKEGKVPSVVRGKVLRKPNPASTLEATGEVRATPTGYPSVPVTIMEYIQQLDSAESEDFKNFKVPWYENLVTNFNSVKKDPVDQAMIEEGYSDKGRKQEYIDLAYTPRREQKGMLSKSIQARVAGVFWYDVLSVAKNRQFAITEKGYMGWVPPNAQKGDKVCLLFGGQVPYIIRPQGGGYRFLGEAYVHGIMNGEALERPGIKVEIIKLR